MELLDKRDALLISSVVLSARCCFRSVDPLPTWFVVLSKFVHLQWVETVEREKRHDMDCFSSQRHQTNHHASFQWNVNDSMTTLTGRKRT